MKSQICYCAAEDAHAAVRNRSNTAGAPAPKIVMGLPCELQLRLFATCEDTAPYPLERLAGIVGWSFEMDTDFSPDSTAKLVARNTGIRLAEVTENGVGYTQITIPIPETRTTELAAALDGKESIILAGELIGYDADQQEAFVLQIKGFEAYGRISGLGETSAVLDLVCETLAEAAVDAVISSGSCVTSSGAALIVSGAVAPVSSALDSRITAVSGGLQSQINALSSGGAAQSGAIVENQPFSTTIDGYTVEYGSNGLTVSYADADLGASATVAVSYGGITLRYGEQGEGELAIGNDGGITANGSAITQASSAFAGTSLGIEELTGGVKYVCGSALSALSIGSAAEGCNGTILFTAASGAVVEPPANVPRFGVSDFTPGSRYVMAVNGDFAVVVEAVAEEVQA